MIKRLASGGATFSENPNGVHDFEQLHIQSPGIAIRGACPDYTSVEFYLARAYRQAMLPQLSESSFVKRKI